MSNGLDRIAPWAATITVMLAIFIGIAIWEHANRRAEHFRIEQTIRGEMDLIRKQAEANIDALVCTSKLNLFFQTLPKGQSIGWQDIPAEYWPCMPRNLINEKKGDR